jgi:acyl-[acyl-carrier-protein]-phospholipid O-acyltransferase/long-chain-fatty-acid--[acyl-carrier-protein] ligase
MLGYYKIDNPGVLQPPADGWHDTGDIVAIDAQGFVAIKGRAKRFAKVGGEMISLAVIEAMAADIWTSAISVVVAVPDARKGERLVLVTTESGATRDAILKMIKARGRSELMLPAEVMIVDKVPLLGSGKPDFVATKALVEKRLAEKAGLAA